MSYDFYIGNAEIAAEWWGEDGPTAEWKVARHTEPDAPTFPHDYMTGNSNGRHPGYSQWSEFCRLTGLTDLFFGDGGILATHPGIVRLTPAMRDAVQVARERWQTRYPEAVPGFDYDTYIRDAVDDGVRGRDAILARLLWLEWWMTWALRTCQRPAFANS